MTALFPLVCPPALEPGDRVAVVAPAGACRAEALAPGLAVLRGFGLAPVPSEVLYQRHRYLAGEDELRARALMAAFEDPSIAGIVCARGGYGSLRLLSRLDFDRMAAHPKRLVGFSDISALLWAVSDRAGLVCFHGPTVASLAKADPPTVEALRAALMAGPEIIVALDEARFLTAGDASGHLCGGNLTTLCHLLGTAFAPHFDGGIVVLEDRGEAPYRIDRMLTQLRLAGALDGVGAVVLGDFIDCGAEADLWAVFEDLLGDLGIPVVVGCGIGHGRRNLAWPLGLPARLDAARAILEVTRGI
jgi:muramoyltetrapeptide carboxypeptidase